ncbi:MAG TPA: TylF/MycF/NovP-related O-methyltransferase [Thermoplasmata archaeon]|nr:TylF/MycF/NovP-related O-methyltransferase [Thermoplasmata archaeon]
MRRKGSTRPYTMLTGLTAWTAQRFGWSDPGVEDEFVPIYEKCREFTGTSWERLYALYKSVKYVIDSGVPGDLVECGVWRGGSVMMIAYTLLAADVKDRSVFLYDTFEGMSKPTTEDADSTSRTPAEIRWRAEARETGNAWASASLAEVKRNVYSTGYPQSRLTFVKGRVEETIPRTIPEKISLLRLDTDWYASTKHELEHLYPRLAREGVLVLDDYGHWLGARKAVDEYFASHPPAILLNRVDYTGRVGIKSRE